MVPAIICTVHICHLSTYVEENILSMRIQIANDLSLCCALLVYASHKRVAQYVSVVSVGDSGTVHSFFEMFDDSYLFIIYTVLTSVFRYIYMIYKQSYISKFGAFSVDLHTI